MLAKVSLTAPALAPTPIVEIAEGRELEMVSEALVKVSAKAALKLKRKKNKEKRRKKVIFFVIPSLIR